MKITVGLILTLIAQLSLFAASVELPKNMVSSFADRVSVFDAKLPDKRFDKLRQFKLTIKLHASVTNSICIRLGRNGMFGTKDNLLAMEESMCGFLLQNNFVQNNGERSYYSANHYSATHFYPTIFYPENINSRPFALCLN